MDTCMDMRPLRLEVRGALGTKAEAAGRRARRRTEVRMVVLKGGRMRRLKPVGNTRKDQIVHDG